jgi:hypothetical protein
MENYGHSVKALNVWWKILRFGASAAGAPKSPPSKRPAFSEVHQSGKLTDAENTIVAAFQVSS